MATGDYGRPMRTRPLSIILSRGWPGTAATLRDALAGEGVALSRQAVAAWMGGAAHPEPRCLPPLCRVLNLDTAHARELYAACGIPLPEVVIGDAR